MKAETVILAVDDSAESLSLLVKLLTPAGYVVRAADSGELALAAAALSPPDLILLDVRMEGLDGTEVCRRLKAAEETRNVPVILLSAFAEARDWVAGLRAGAVDFLTKPFQPEELLARVRTHLALRRASEALERQAAEFREANVALQAEIVERRRAEDQLVQSLDEAERSSRALLGALEDQQRAAEELRLRNLILSTQQDASIDGILVAGVDGQVISSNRRFAEMWAVPPEVLDRRSYAETLQRVAEALADPEDLHAEAGRHGSDDERRHREVLLKDGRTVDLYSAPMLEGGGGNFGRVWFFRDVTERRRADEDRERLQEQLRISQRIEAVGKLAGGIAHDFNNLLSVILSYTGFALASLEEESPLRKDLLEVKKSGERAAALTRQLLAFSRKQVLQPQQLSLNRIASGIEEMLSRILGEDIDLVLKLAPDLDRTLADPGQVEQALMNLVINARDAMPNGGKLTIETSNLAVDAEYAARYVALQPGHYVRLAVTDTGCGMDRETQARVFEPFFTTKEKGKGTGLGLSTVYGIVKQSGGYVWVYSEPGKGTMFEILLPRDASGATAPAEAPAAAAAAHRTTGSETILVVEDEEALRQVATRSLGAVGYSVLSAANGEEAIRTVVRHSGPLHLLVTDVVMPGMGGTTLAQEILRRRPGVKVLFMSGYTDDAIVRHGVLEAGTHFLPKPFTAPDLERKVREVLDGGAGPFVQRPERPPEHSEGVARRPLSAATLPPGLVEKLRDAAIAARYDELLELIDSFEVAEPQLSAELRGMAERFDFDAIRAVLNGKVEAIHAG